MPVENGVISIREAARRCGRNPETIRRWVWSGKLPAEKLGNQLFIKESDLAAFRSEAVAADGAPQEPARMRDDSTTTTSGQAATRQETRADLIRRLRDFRASVRLRIGDIDVGTTVQQSRKERTDGLTGMH